jgi:hypothetical protein
VETLLRLVELAFAEVRALSGARAVLHDGPDGLDTCRPRQLANLGKLLLGVDPLAQHGENEAALGLGDPWNHRR